MPFDGFLPNEQTDIEILMRARNLISQPHHWCKGHFESRRLMWMVDAATNYHLGAQWVDAYCILGALSHAAGNPNPAEPSATEQRLISLLYQALPLRYRLFRANHTVKSMRRAVYRYNDRDWRTHSSVLAVFDKAIERLQSVNAYAA